MASVSVKAINTFISSTNIQNIGITPQTRIDALIDYKNLKNNTAYKLSLYLYKITEDGDFEVLKDVNDKDCMVKNLSFDASSEYTDVTRVSLQIRGPLSATFRLSSVWTGSQGSAYASYPFLVDYEDTMYVKVVFEEVESLVKIESDTSNTDSQIRFIKVEPQSKALGTYDLSHTIINNTLRLNNVPCDTEIKVTTEVRDRQTTTLIHRQEDYFFDVDRTLYGGSDSKYDFVEPKIECDLSSYANREITVQSNIHVLGGNSPQPIPMRGTIYRFNSSDIIMRDFKIQYTPVIDIYKTDGTKITIPSNNCDMYISNGSLSLKKAIVDNEIVFGQPISSEFSCEIYNVTEDLSGSQIKLWLENVETHSKKAMFTGFIDSCTTDFIGTMDGQGSFRKITAYDWFYFHRDDDVVTKVNDSTKTFNITKWFKQTFKETADMSDFPTHLENFVRGMGFTYIEPRIAYVNSDSGPAPIPNNVLNKLSVVTVGQVIKMLCEPMCIFPYIDNSGNMTFTTLDGYRDSQYARQFDPFILYDYNFEKSNSTREEYTTKPIWGVDIYDSENNKKFGSEGTPDGYTKYVSSGNLLLSYNIEVEPPETHHGQSVSDNVEIIGYKWSDYLNELSYLPCSVKMIMADFNNIHLGQQFYFRDLMSDIKYSYVMAIEYSGECLCEQTIKCIAKSEGLSNRAITSNSKLNENRISAELSSKIEDVSTDLNNTKTNLTNNYTPKSDAVKSETRMHLATSFYEGVENVDGIWGTWTEANQELTPTNKYAWEYIIYTYANNTTTKSNPTMVGVYGDKGDDGTFKLPGTYGKEYMITSDYQWVATDKRVDDRVVYQSDSNYHVDRGEARCTITFSGYETFTIYARSNGDYGHDYLEVGKLDAPTIIRDGDNYDSFKYDSTHTTTYKEITFSGLDKKQHTIKLLYSKDGAIDKNEDRAFFYIPEGTAFTEDIKVESVSTIYYQTDDDSVWPSAPTEPVTSAGFYNEWSNYLDEVDSAHPYVFSCSQTIYSDGSCKWGRVNIDQASLYSYAQIEVLKNKIVLKVDVDGSIAAVQLSANPEEGSAITIRADQIDLTGKQINLTSDNITIHSTNFNVDQAGNVTCNNATMNNANVVGGSIKITKDNFKYLLDSDGLSSSYSYNNSEYELMSCNSYKQATTNVYMTVLDLIGYDNNYRKNCGVTLRPDSFTLGYFNSNSNVRYPIFNIQLDTSDNTGLIQINNSRVDINNPVSISGNLLLDGNLVTTSGNIVTSQGAITGFSLKATNDLTVDNDATVTGKITSSSDIQGLNLKATNNLTVSNNATITGNLTAANIGKYLYKNSNWDVTSIPNTTLTKLGSITLENGLWIVVGKIQLSNGLDVNQRLQVGVGLTTTSTNILGNSVVSTASTNKPSAISMASIINVTSNNTDKNVYLYAYQNTGSAQAISTSVTGTWLRAIRIK